MAEEPKRTMNQTCEGGLDDEINLLDYWRVIWKRRRMIGWIVIVTVFTTVAVSLFMTDIYRAQTVIVPVTAKEGGGGGGMAALVQQFAGVPGISIPGSSSAAEIVSLLKSNILREKMIRQYNLMPVLFYKRWDPQRQDWKKGGRYGFFNLGSFDYADRIKRAFAPDPSAGAPRKDPEIPDTWDALRLLDDIIRINQDAKQSTITLSVDFHNPALAAKIADYYLATLTDYMSSETKRVATTNRKYLEEQLGSTADPIIKQKTYNMIAQQIETGMMAEVKENFAFKIIDPPLAPDKKNKPKRAQMAVVSLVAALFAGILAAFIREHIARLREKK